MKEDLFYYHYWLQLKPQSPPVPLHIMQNDFLQNVYKVIEENLDNYQLSVRFLAINMRVSKSTLNRKLSALTGLSANELIRKCRLQKAVFFLAQGKNVTEAAYLTGFQTPSYFTQCFKAYYKITPKEYSKIYWYNNDKPLIKTA